MNIYYYSKNYPELRCCIDISSDNSYISLLGDKPLTCLIERIIRIISSRFSALMKEKCISRFFFFHRKGIIHSFNYTIHGGADWICSFETITPRTNYTRNLSVTNNSESNFDFLTKVCIKDLISPKCKALLAISRSAYSIELKFLNNCVPPKERDTIIRKLHILHPPQKALVTHYDIDKKFSNESELTFIFIGNDFFRKGGAEIVDSLIQLSSDYKFRLIVVSNLSYNDYATASDYDKMLEYKNKLEQHSWIDWYINLDNSKVLNLCQSSHIGLLPTIADTYGYSVLEMQASGCPVITTDIRSLPEINNTDCGWLIHLPQDDLHEAFYNTEDQRMTNHNTIYNGLLAIFLDIITQPRHSLCKKAHCSLDRIIKDHSPQKYANMVNSFL